MTLHRIRAALVACALTTALVAISLGASFALANPGNENISTAATQTLPIIGLTGSLDSTTTDARDVYKIHLTSGQTLDVSMVASAGTDFDIFLYKSSVTSIDESATPRVAWSHGPTSSEHFTYMAANSGDYYLDVHAWAGASSYILNAKRIPSVAFKMVGLTLRGSAKRGTPVKMSVTVTPGYNGSYSPINFYIYRYESHKWKRKAILWGQGRRTSDQAKTVLGATYRFPKRGKWRMRAGFWDEGHQNEFFSPHRGYKYITIK